MNRAGRLTIIVVLLIVALLVIWQTFGAAWDKAEDESNGLPPLSP